MLRKIKNLFYAIKKQYITRKATGKRFVECAEYLKNGNFVSNNSYSILYPKNATDKNEDNFIYQEQLFRNYDFFKKIVIKLFFSPIKLKIKSNNKIFYGDRLIMPTLNKEIKIINSSEKKILTLFNSKQRYEELLKKRQLWAKYFNTVDLLEYNDQKLYYIEEFIEKKDFNKNDAFSYIFDSILKISNDVPKNLNVKCDFYYKKETKTFLKNNGIPELYDSLENYLLSSSYKTSLSHGDLYRYNVISDGNNYYYIDFENVGTHIFYFDVMYYIFDESFTFNNDGLLNDYMNGKFDEKFEKLFRIYGENYDKNNRGIYMLTVIAEFYCANIEHQTAQRQIDILFNKSRN